MDILPNIKADIKADLTESINTAVNTAVAPIQDTHKGISKLFGAFGGKWIANKEAQVSLIEAQTAKDVEDIKAGKKEYRDGNLITLGKTDDPNIAFQQICENNAACDAKRLQSAMREAALEISDIPEDEISDDPLNQTFFNHWRKEAELIDDEDLRKMWSHLLVEEIRKPNSISPRTLDIVKNLSRQEAEIFSRVLLGVVGDSVVISREGEPIFGNYDEILALQDARLVASQTSSKVYNFKIEDPHKKKVIVIPFLESSLALVFEKEEIHCRCHILTSAGREINDITKTPLSLEQIKKIAEEISRQNNNAIAYIIPFYTITSDPNEEIKYQCFWDILWTNRQNESSKEGTAK